MSRRNNSIAVTIASALLVMTLSACEKKGPAEQAGEKIDNAADKAGQQIEKAGDKLQDSAKGDHK